MLHHVFFFFFFFLSFFSRVPYSSKLQTIDSLPVLIPPFSSASAVLLCLLLIRDGNNLNSSTPNVPFPNTFVFLEMQRLASPGLVQKLQAKTPWDPQVRYKHKLPPFWYNSKAVPMRKRVLPPFQASTLLLDLDAEGSPYVRPYDEELDGVPMSAWRVKNYQMYPLKIRVAEFENLSRRYDRAFQATIAQKFNPWHISDHDILTATLLDVPSKPITAGPRPAPKPDSNSPIEHIYEYILDQNGIPHTVRNNAYGVIEYMKTKQRIARVWPRKSNVELSIKNALRRCLSLPELKRLTGRLTQTPEGCLLVSGSAATIVHVCKDGLDHVPPTHLLSFLNDLTITISRQIQQIPVELSQYGIELSLQLCAFETVQMHLKILLKAGHKLPASMTIQILKTLRSFVTPNQTGNGNTNPAHNDDLSRYLAIFSLLTGRDLEPGLLQPSLRDLVTDPADECYLIYFECLAQMGAFRTMWYEWQQVEMHNGGHDDCAEADREMAFIRAVEFAINNSDGTRELIHSKDFTVATGQYHEDYQLDMKSILQFADQSKRPYEHPPQRITGVQSDKQDRRKIVEAFKKKTVQETLLALQGLFT
ncbi:hypothetical protein F4810DRAFT_14776 [Camillea tinctor]|nr:hypothetical protein F4810DRAFT_14776 [Camillea tinctor]